MQRFYVDVERAVPGGHLKVATVVEAASRREALARHVSHLDGLNACFALPDFMDGWGTERVVDHYWDMDFQGGVAAAPESSWWARVLLRIAPGVGLPA